VVGGSGRQATKVEAATEAAAATSATEAVEEAASAKQQRRCHVGGGGGRRGGRCGGGNSSGGVDRGSGGNKGSGDNKGSGGNRRIQGNRGSGDKDGNSSGMATGSIVVLWYYVSTIPTYVFFYKFISYVASYVGVGPIQTGFPRGGTGILIPVKKKHRNRKHRNPEDSCRNRQPSGIVLPHCNGHQNGQQSKYMLHHR
jgi:hypothetical protein